MTAEERERERKRRQAAKEAQTEAQQYEPEGPGGIEARLPFAASGAVPETQGPSGGPDAEGEWITREYPSDPAPLIRVSKKPSEDVVEGTYLRRTKPLYGAYGEDSDLEPVDFRRNRPMSMREAADAGLFEDRTPRGVEMDPADKVRAGFMRPFAERGQKARPGATTGRQVDEILQRLERAREMDNKQMDVQAGGAGEQFRRGLAETRDLRWGASGPTSAVNRAIAERRGRGEQTDEAIRLAKEAPPPQAGAAKPLTPNQAGALMMRRASLLQGDGVTPLRPEALEEARKIDELLSEGGYGGGAAGKEKPGEGGAEGKGKPGERVWNAKYKAYYIRQPDGTFKRERR